MRLLSRWELLVDGRPPQPMTVQQPEPLPPSSSPGGRARAARARPCWSCAAATSATACARTSRSSTTRRCRHRAGSTLLAATDFADVFEVKAGTARGNGWSRPRRPRRPDLSRRGASSRGRRGATVRRRGRRRHRAVVEARPPGAGHVVDVRRSGGCRRRRPRCRCAPARPAGRARRSLPAAAPGGAAARMRTADPDLAQVLRRSVEDLGTLRIFDPGTPTGPWSPPARRGSWRRSAGTRC